RRHGDAGQERDAPAGSREQSGRAPCMLVLCHETLPLPPPGGAAPRAILPVTLGPPPKPAATRGKSRGQHYAERARVWWRYGGRVVGLLSISSRVDSFPRVAIPAGGQITLDHSGDYVIYYEGPGAQSGQIPAFRIRVTPASAGAAVQSLGPYNSSVTYAFGSH